MGNRLFTPPEGHAPLGKPVSSWQLNTRTKDERERPDWPSLTRRNKNTRELSKMLDPTLCRGDVAAFPTSLSVNYNIFAQKAPVCSTAAMSQAIFIIRRVVKEPVNKLRVEPHR